MSSGRPFSLKVVSFDRRRMKTSGRVLDVAEAILLQNEVGDAATAPGQSRLDALESSMGGNYSRRLNHGEHGTLNVQPCYKGLPTMELPVKIHTRLVIFFNEKPTLP